MDEFEFELRLCAHLEAETEAIIARQLGGGAVTSGRVLDIVLVEPGPAFADRAALTDQSIPSTVLEAEFGPGRFRDWRRELGDGMAAEQAIERALQIGYLEREFDGGRELVRPVGRYPDGWFDRIVAIENKPDLAEPGDLYEQLQFDVSLGLVDEVVLATGSHITRAHRNRLPDAVGLWRFDAGSGALDVVRESRPLPVDQPGLEVHERRPGATEVEPIEADAKPVVRRRLAERAYGKGWRTFTLPPCANLDPSGGPAPGMPWCRHFDRVVNPTSDCGESCHGHRPAPPPAVHLDGIRDDRSPWVADPPDRRSRQGRLSDQWTA